MTNELRDELAKVICFADGVYPDAIKHQFPETSYWQDYTDHAQAVIDHLTPMMKEVVGALEKVGGNGWFKEIYHGAFYLVPVEVKPDIQDAIASLPACWREKESTHD
jgi:hypothetical protein